MGSRREQVLAVALILLVVVLALFAAPDPERRSFDPRLSSLRSTPQGAMALYLLLEELDIPVERRLTPYVDADPLAGPLALLAPTQSPSPAEVAALIDWIERGGELIYVATPPDPVLEALGLELEWIAASPERPFAAGVEARPVPHRWTEETDRVAGFRWAFAELSAVAGEGGVTPLLRTEDEEVVALALRRGAGRVVAWSDPRPLSNQELRTSGAALPFARAAAELTGREGTLYFDEYHHGYRAGGSPVQALLGFLRHTGPGRAALQLLVVAAGLLLLLGRRFGSPHPPPPARRRSPLEHVEALAGAYHQAGARTTARRLLVAGLARRLGRAAPPAGREAEFLERLDSRAAAGRESARELLAEWRKADRADLVTLTRLADRLVAETRSL